jgi:hypothetical protein
LNYRFNTLDKAYEIVRYSGTVKTESPDSSIPSAIDHSPFNLFGNRTITVKMTTPLKKVYATRSNSPPCCWNIEQLKLEKEKSEALIRYLESRQQ